MQRSLGIAVVDIRLLCVLIHHGAIRQLRWLSIRYTPPLLALVQGEEQGPHRQNGYDHHAEHAQNSAQIGRASCRERVF